MQKRLFHFRSCCMVLIESTMKTVKAYWTYLKAAKLLDDEHSCCKRLTSDRLVPVMPKYIGKWRTGIKEILDLELGKYTERLNGVLLGYNNIKMSATSQPLDDQPSMHFTLQMDAIVFQPAIGAMLKCTVNEIAPDHIGCLAHNYFNVSIPLPKQTGRRNGNQHRLSGLKQGTKLVVEIYKIQSMHGIISIQGKVPEDFAITVQRSIVADIPMETTTSEEFDSSASVSPIKSHEKEKRRKRKHSPVPMEITSSDLDSSLDVFSPKLKKKKKKKQLKENPKAILSIKAELSSDLDADATHTHDDADCLKSPESSSHHKSKRKNKDGKKNKSDVDSSLASPITPKNEKSMHSEFSLDNSTMDVNSVIDSASKSSKKKKKRITGISDVNKDSDRDIHTKTEPESDAHEHTSTDSSSQRPNYFKSNKKKDGKKLSFGSPKTPEKETMKHSEFSLDVKNSSSHKSSKKKKQKHSTNILDGSTVHNRDVDTDGNTAMTTEPVDSNEDNENPESITLHMSGNKKRLSKKKKGHHDVEQSPWAKKEANVFNATKVTEERGSGDADERYKRKKHKKHIKKEND